MTLKSVVLLSAALALPVAAFEEDPAKLCQSAAELFKEGDIEGALEEARWCVTQLEQLKQNQTAKYFKDEILGFKGEELSQQSAMGMTVVERTYNKGDKYIRVSLTGGAASGAMGAFSALAQFGMQANTNANKVRIQRRTAVVSKDGSDVTVMVTLKSGSMLNFESSNVSQEDVVNFAKQFPVKDLDNSLQQ